MFTPKQLFFAQRLLESLDYRAIDSYRVRFLNPLRALEELAKVYRGCVQGRFKQYDYLDYCIQETTSLLKKEEILKFPLFTKTFFIDLLSEVEKDNFKEHYPTIKTAIRSILNANDGYTEQALTKLKKILEEPDDRDPFKDQFTKIERLTLTIGTELLRKGYAKSYAYSHLKEEILKTTEPFPEAFLKLVSFVTAEPATFKVVLKVYSGNLKLEDWVSVKGWQITQQGETSKVMKKYVVKWLTPKNNNYFFLTSDQSAMDHRSAASKAVASLAEIMDLMKLANRDTAMSLSNTAVAYPLGNEKLAGLPKIKERSDGHFTTSDDLLNSLKKKTAAVLNNKDVDDATKEKIKSATRYLRFGLDSTETGQEYLNYWIGLEYLFSNLSDSTFSRIKEILPDLQTLLYFKRNLTDFNKSVARTKTSSTTKGYDDSMVTSLLKEECLNSIRDDIYDEVPLLSFRAWKLKNRILKKSNDQGMRRYHDRHRENLVWHLSRLYRIRNQIVHEASYQSTNPILTANLRYYLTFVLGLTIEYFSRDRLEATSIEEYFALLQLQLKSLSSDSFPPEELVALDHEINLIA